MASTEHLGSGGRFIPDLKKARFLKSLSPNAEIWTLYYELSSILSPRVFTVLQVKQLSDVDSRREGYAFLSFSSLPIRQLTKMNWGSKLIASSCLSR